MEENKVNTLESGGYLGHKLVIIKFELGTHISWKKNRKHLSIWIHFCFFFFFFFFFFIIFNEKKKKKKRGQILLGRIAPAILTKIQEAAIISVNICAQKEGIVPKTTSIA